MRKIPTGMATQHPDNAGKPYWHSRAFVSTAAELKECFLCFSDLGIDEYNWDWEGKYVDEAVVDRLLHQHLEYFQKHPLGRDKFLTFRIPNPRVEKQFRLARAFMVMITSSQLSQSLGFDDPPIFETILPLTESAQEIIDIQEAFQHLVSLEHKLLKMRESMKSIEIIPLFEQVAKIVESPEILKRYIVLHRNVFRKIPAYIRPYCARSDPALNSGLVPTIVSLKIALWEYRKLERQTGVKLYPMVGTGSLPFRGGISPSSIETGVEEYRGVATLTLQSAFRYDYEKTQVRDAVEFLKKYLPGKTPISIHDSQKKAVIKSIPFFEKYYQQSIEKLAPIINSLSTQLARRRERMQHIGLFGYSRGFGGIILPRAIPFTAALYSIGIPPELIGTGRGIREAKRQGIWTEILPLYVNFRSDMIKAGYFLNKENVTSLANVFGGWEEVLEDIEEVEKEIGEELGPRKGTHFEHYALSGRIFKALEEKKKMSNLLSYGGMLRKSLG
ncbi:phosphoenolpyruvate carboxylase [Candidatus Gottesmanbacteria bacterium]|nr:phosphoenolpyruvate carboxylase [Candidatus Gottesmanbacteria bacterium]